MKRSTIFIMYTCTLDTCMFVCGCVRECERMQCVHMQCVYVCVCVCSVCVCVAVVVVAISLAARGWRVGELVNLRVLEGYCMM